MADAERRLHSRQLFIYSLAGLVPCVSAKVRCRLPALRHAGTRATTFQQSKRRSGNLIRTQRGEVLRASPPRAVGVLARSEPVTPFTV